MAMAAGAVSSAIAPVVEESKEIFDRFKADPILWVSNFLIKAGAVVFLLGVGAYFISKSSARAAQGYLSDADNVLGINQESPPTPPRNFVPLPQPPPAPPPPLQVSYMNAIVEDVNNLGTASAQANVAVLQDMLTRLWALARYVYGDNAGTATQYPAIGTGELLAISIMQTCALVYEMEGRQVPSTPEWTWEWYQGNQVGVYDLTNGRPLKLLQAMSGVASAPYSLQGEPNWDAALSQTSSTVNNDNFKITLNGLAQGLNLSQPFNVTAPSSGNQWGVIGTIVSDLGGIGTAIAQGAETVGSDVENALIQAGKDLNSAVTQIGGGLAFIGKAFVNFPRLLGDAVGYSASWGAEMIADALYTPLLVAGAGMFIGGSVMKFGYVRMWPKVESRVTLAANVGAARLWNRIDKRLRIRKSIAEVRKQAVTETAIQSANTLALPVVEPTPVTPIPPEPAQDQALPPPEDIQPVPASENALATPPGEPPEAVEVTKTVETTIPGGSTTEETEVFLGEHPTRAPTPDELRAQEANRVASLPPPGPSYRQRKEEREHERAERLLAMGKEWGET
jgi:hypothetical protein